MSRVNALLGVLLGFAAVLASPPGRAEKPRGRSAFAVVIGNNRSLEQRRPDLHYADDDAAKYFAILQTVVTGSAYLLADFDEDTTRLFPAIRARAASLTRAELLRAGQEIAEDVRRAAAAGHQTDVYFVFAGHGDVDQGTGFIELADARFTSDDLEQWLRAIPFSRAHVILDSCNSFFMLGARRPGGRYYATSEDAARALAARLPNVGVFLSTSAEGESFEWSEIQSGVFSHVVRSGLLGAADADGDGNVTYLELAAFVATATADVVNPNMRPHVFSRGPGGRDDLSIVGATARRGAHTFRLSDSAPMRVRVRDRDSVPILDANEEAGFALTLTLPDEWTDGAVLERAGATGRAATLQTFAVPIAPADVTLAALQPITARGATRGPAEIFRRLFQRPFGPGAVASYLAQAKAAVEPIFGVSREDAERMGLLLGQIESAEHGRRMVGATLLFGGAAYFGALGGTALAFDRSDPGTRKSAADMAGAISMGVGAAFLAAGSYMLARPWSAERLAADYREAVAKRDYAHAFAVTNEKIRDLAAAEARDRWMRGVAGGVVLVGSTALIAAAELSGASAPQRYDVRAIGGFGAVLGLASIASSIFVQTPVQHLTTVWRRDPDLIHMQPTLAPTRSGATFGLVGAF